MSTTRRLSHLLVATMLFVVLALMATFEVPRGLRRLGAFTL
jgi:HAMP domain-containing protein